MGEGERVRFLLASDTSGHTAGYYVVAQGLRDAGIEVVAIGHAEPPQIADAALQEDVDMVGYRIMDRDPLELVATLRGCLDERGLGELPLVVGGIIRPDAIPALKEKGVVGVFGPGSRLPDVVAFVCQHGRPRTSRPPASSGHDRLA